MSYNPFGSRTQFETGNGTAELYRLSQLEKEGVGHISSLPMSIKVLLESVLRHCDNQMITEDDVARLATWNAKAVANAEIPFMPARVVLQDFTGVPALVDLAAMRSAMQRLGGDPKKIEPRIPSELVVDHSVQVDRFAQPDALFYNMQIEFERNRERYEFLKWGQNAFEKFTVVPPGVGIVHQVNLEYFARGVFLEKGVAYPDSLVGTDSHTTMINGLGIVGWGVGGIEAEAVMLGQPIYMLMPEVIGFKLTGQLPEGATATDLVLVVTQMLREKGVVGKFVEFYGPGLSHITLTDRATVANMAPEYGATMGFFPMDAGSLEYMRRTGRSEEQVQLVEQYTKAQGLFRTDETPDPEYTDTLELDLSDVEPSVAGPKRPQDRIRVVDLKSRFQQFLTAPAGHQGFNIPAEEVHKTTSVQMNGQGEATMTHGSVVIAAITSCTNTSNPSVMLGAGILAKKAVEKGLKVPPYVKTSLAPGSRVVTEYLNESGLTDYLNQLGFHTVGYGCTTCIGNSGPLPEAVANAIQENDIVAAAVLSGNRNFEGRVNPLTRANFLASPPLVVAYALAGTVDIDLMKDPIGTNDAGEAVYLKDIWPTTAEIDQFLENATNPDTFKKMYRNLDEFNPEWNKIPMETSELYNWRADSTYIQEPPFFTELTPEIPPIRPIENARVLMMLGDSVTTDHISPAGAIPEGPAADYLRENGVERKDFNSFGSRRGNDRVMVRGTFANIRIRNKLAPGTEGGITVHLPSGEQMWVYDAAMKYKAENVPLIVLGGKDYGMGSSRDWAAKGTVLLGVKAVFAESYERIHRSNLVGMGVLPFQFVEGNAESIGLTGKETYHIPIHDNLKPQEVLEITATRDDGSTVAFKAKVLLNSEMEIKYYRNGGILQTVLREMLAE
ncbi:MAG: aconitate hydratase AcnA [Gemmatimonadetes bacterium]|nr:MAG: aconitate hydratase AcnA [Gemmatimonadota bacterium]